MPVPLRAVVDTSLPAAGALEALVRPGPVPGRRVLRDDPAEVLYVDDEDVTSHFVLMMRTLDEATRAATGVERVDGHVTGPFGDVKFTIRAVETAAGTRVELTGSYEPKGLLLRIAPRRSARFLAEELRESMAGVLGKWEEEGRRTDSESSDEE